MTEADACIGDLDAAIAEVGQDIVLQRFSTDAAGTQTIILDAPCRAIVRAHLPQQLSHVAYMAPVTHVVLSPTSLTLADWPGLPARDDRLLIEGEPSNVETISPILVDGVVVRINLTCLAFQ